MTGPEHYLEAERLHLMSWEDDREPENVTRLLARAQVHATLALAAAAAMGSADMFQDDFEAWDKVCGVHAADEDKAADTARADLAELELRNTLLQNTAANMLNAFVHKTHPGYPAMQSRHVDMDEINRWRGIVWPTPQKILEK